MGAREWFLDSSAPIEALRFPLGSLWLSVSFHSALLPIFGTPSLRCRTSEGRLARSWVRESRPEGPFGWSEGVFRSSGLRLGGWHLAARRSGGAGRRSEGAFTRWEGLFRGSAAPLLGQRQLFLSRRQLLQASGKQRGVPNSQWHPPTSQKLPRWEKESPGGVLLALKTLKSYGFSGFRPVLGRRRRGWLGFRATGEAGFQVVVDGVRAGHTAFGGLFHVRVEG